MLHTVSVESKKLFCDKIWSVSPPPPTPPRVESMRIFTARRKQATCIAFPVLLSKFCMPGCPSTFFMKQDGPQIPHCDSTCRPICPPPPREEIRRAAALGGVRKVLAQMLSVVHTWDQKACAVGRWLTVLSLSLPTLMSPQASEMRLKHPISSLPLPKKRRGEDGPSSLGRLYLQPFAPKGGRGKLRIFYEESHFPRVPPSIPPLFSLKMNLPKKGP